MNRILIILPLLACSLYHSSCPWRSECAGARSREVNTALLEVSLWVAAGQPEAYG